ncbi:MAG: FeoA domain-containing protein [Erysipelotrichaceae bacterium]
MKLNEIARNKMVSVVQINNSGSIRRRLFDLGIIKDTEIRCVLESPTHLMKAYRINETTIALRENESKDIEVKYIRNKRL